MSRIYAHTLSPEQKEIQRGLSNRCWGGGSTESPATALTNFSRFLVGGYAESVIASQFRGQLTNHGIDWGHQALKEAQRLCPHRKSLLDQLEAAVHPCPTPPAELEALGVARQLLTAVSLGLTDLEECVPVLLGRALPSHPCHGGLRQLSGKYVRFYLYQLLVGGLLEFRLTDSGRSYLKRLMAPLPKTGGPAGTKRTR